MEGALLSFSFLPSFARINQLLRPKLPFSSSSSSSSLLLLRSTLASRLDERGEEEEEEEETTTRHTTTEKVRDWPKLGYGVGRLLKLNDRKEKENTFQSSSGCFCRHFFPKKTPLLHRCYVCKKKRRKKRKRRRRENIGALLLVPEIHKK